MSLAVHGFAARHLADYRARKPGTLFAEDDYPHLTLATDRPSLQGSRPVSSLSPKE